ncbi:MAG: sigma-70 family RNA polymerase sigma factor [Candidatus Hydrogenedentes bacterium]|nr:sigma-70 family RNA polymerase sigma factor [Candidatus Hydrogenedentota bacterium]
MTADEFEMHALSSSDGLYSYALRLTQNQEDAADLVQETFVKALKRLEGFREPSAVRPVLFTILYHCFVDLWRKKKRRPRLVALPDPDELEELTSAALPNPARYSSGLLGEALSQEVSAALGDLDDELRETLWLREIEDFSYTEIAGILGLPLGTVRSRLSRARSQMAASLQSFAKQRGYTNPRSGKEGS